MGSTKTEAAAAAALPDFLATGLEDFLAADRRPTLVFDFQGSTHGQDLAIPIFANTAFRSLRDRYPPDSRATRSEETFLGLQQWALSHMNDAFPQTEIYHYAGHEWRRFLVSSRWNVVTSLECPPEQAADHDVTSPSRQGGEMQVAPIKTDHAAQSFDWTDGISADIPEYVKLIRSRDWASTSLGPLEDWPFQLRTMFNVIMRDPSPAVAFWGKNLTMIYNEGYAHIAGSKHPEMLAKAASIVWAEVWDHFVPIFERGWQHAQATQEKDILFIFNRQGFDEETYITYTILPLIGDDGAVTGFYQHVTESTGQVLSQRRMTILLALSQLGAAAESLKQYYRALIASMEPFAIDIPVAVLYSIDQDAPSATAVLEGSVGTGDAVLEASFDPGSANHVLASILREAEAAGGQITLDERDDHWPLPMHQYQNPDRGFGDVCNQATVYLLRPSLGAATRGLLIVGLNRRQPLNSDQQEFRNVLGRQINSTLAAVTLFEDEARENLRRVEEAARDMDIIENRFYRVAQLSPVGIFVMNKDGSVIYCNDKWYEYAGVTKGSGNEGPWMNFVWPEDLELVTKQWTTVIEDAVPINFEFRYKASRKQSPDQGSDSLDNDPFAWFLGSAYPDFDDDGKFLSISGSLTDISQQKQAERESQRQANSALESKRSQERFMDVTSHELRNPLNAIYQCGDQIVRTLKGMVPHEDQREQFYESIDAAETIWFVSRYPTVLYMEMLIYSIPAIAPNIRYVKTTLVCRDITDPFQRRIADDILTVSKLDSDLINITPVPVQPAQLVRHALKLFQIQAQSAHVELKLDVDESLSRLHVDWVQLDPSRVLQILINLASNAIKFTESEGAEGSVRIGLAASLSDPSRNVASGIRYLEPRHIPQAAANNTPDASPNTQVFLSFHVKDTGRGLSDEEQSKLFNRFVQASPRTHVQYGGTGLGLYISRSLTELQGGRIGLASQPRNGSLFAFYVKATRCDPPELSPSTDSEAHPDKQLGSPAGLSFTKWISSASILIVEDNLVNLKVLRRQLGPLVRETHTAGHGMEALDVIRQSKHWTANGGDGHELSAILLDVEMPVMGGLACIREIRRLQREGEITGQLYVIAITANARQEQIREAKEAGMDAVLIKPFLVQDLRNYLEQAFISGNFT